MLLLLIAVTTLYAIYIHSHLFHTCQNPSHASLGPVMLTQPIFWPYYYYNNSARIQITATTTTTNSYSISYRILYHLLYLVILIFLSYCLFYLSVLFIHTLLYRHILYYSTACLLDSCTSVTYFRDQSVLSLGAGLRAIQWKVGSVFSDRVCVLGLPLATDPGRHLGWPPSYRYCHYWYLSLFYYILSI